MFYVLEVGKAKSTTQSSLMISTLSELFQKFFSVFYFTIGKSRQNKGTPLDFLYNCVTPYRSFKA